MKKRKSDRRARPASALRRQVSPVPDDALGVKQEWTWTPEVPVNKELIRGASPTTEYSSNESNE